MRTNDNDNPNEVSSESQREKIHKYLLEGETITSLEALKLFQCFRLASRMTDLKKREVPFDSVFINTPTSKKRVKAYFIPEAFAKKHGLEIDDKLATHVSLYATEKISVR
jgi:hypothetical protein